MPGGSTAGLSVPAFTGKDIRSFGVGEPGLGRGTKGENHEVSTLRHSEGTYLVLGLPENFSCGKPQIVYFTGGPTGYNPSSWREVLWQVSPGESSMLPAYNNSMLTDSRTPHNHKIGVKLKG